MLARIPFSSIKIVIGALCLISFLYLALNGTSSTPSFLQENTRDSEDELYSLLLEQNEEFSDNSSLVSDLHKCVLTRKPESDQEIAEMREVVKKKYEAKKKYAKR